MLDCAIIGGGPAGLTAGLYTTRGGLKNVVMFEMGLPGGQITQSSEIENYPGFFDHTKTGMDFMDSWMEQCFHFGLTHKMEKVLKVKKVDEHFELTLESGEKVESKTVIVATGSTPKRAGFKGEDEFFGRGVSTCATCDGFFYKNREVAVLGGGDTALEEAYYLSKICSKVYLIHRRDEFRASPLTIQRVQKTQNIKIITNTHIKEAMGDSMGLSRLVLENLNAEQSVLEVNGIFVFVGRNINNGVLKSDEDNFICEVNQYGEVSVDLKMRTSVEGLFVAGDLRADAQKQVVCAAGDGAVAGLSVISYIQEME